MESAAAASFAKSPAGMLGQPSRGRPAGTAPIVPTPCAESDSAALATVAPIDGEQRPGHPARKPGTEHHREQHGAGDRKRAVSWCWPRSLAQFHDLGRRPAARAWGSRTGRPAARRPRGCRPR